MPVARRWDVEIYLSEDANGPSAVTHAEARLSARAATDLRGHGHARRNPADADVPEIGDELAAARALSDLAHQLLRAAADEVKSVIHRPVIDLGD